jgi:hypothetical protein
MTKISPRDLLTINNLFQIVPIENLFEELDKVKYNFEQSGNYVKY